MIFPDVHSSFANQSTRVRILLTALLALIIAPRSLQSQVKFMTTDFRMLGGGSMWKTNESLFKKVELHPEIKEQVAKGDFGGLGVQIFSLEKETQGEGQPLRLSLEGAAFLVGLDANVSDKGQVGSVTHAGLTTGMWLIGPAISIPIPGQNYALGVQAGIGGQFEKFFAKYQSGRIITIYSSWRFGGDE